MMGDGTHTKFENIGAKNCKHRDVNCKYKDDKFCFGHVEFEMPVQCSKWKCPLFSPVTERCGVERQKCEFSLYAGNPKSNHWRCR